MKARAPAPGRTPARIAPAAHDSGRGDPVEASALDRLTPQAVRGLSVVAGNRAVRRVLARKVDVKVVGGVETKLVRPAVTKFLQDSKIEFWREVKFELVDAKGAVIATGYFDFVLRDPRTRQLVYRELKGDKLDSLTDNQKTYVPKFESAAGGRVRITSAKGNISFSPGRFEQVSSANFRLIGKPHLGDFGREIGEMATGKKPTNVYIGPDGMKVFYSRADAEAFYKSLPQPPPLTRDPPKPPANDKPLKPPKPPDKPPPVPDKPPTTKKDPPKSGWDPTAGPPPNKTQKGPNFRPQPHDSDKPAKPTPPPAKPAIDKAPTPAPKPAIDKPSAPSTSQTSTTLKNRAKSAAAAAAQAANAVGNLVIDHLSQRDLEAAFESRLETFDAMLKHNPRMGLLIPMRFRLGAQQGVSSRFMSMLDPVQGRSETEAMDTFNRGARLEPGGTTIVFQWLPPLAPMGVEPAGWKPYAVGRFRDISNIRFQRMKFGQTGFDTNGQTSTEDLSKWPKVGASLEFSILKPPSEIRYRNPHTHGVDSASLAVKIKSPYTRGDGIEDRVPVVTVDGVDVVAVVARNDVTVKFFNLNRGMKKTIEFRDTLDGIEDVRWLRLDQLDVIDYLDEGAKADRAAQVAHQKALEEARPSGKKGPGNFPTAEERDEPTPDDFDKEFELVGGRWVRKKKPPVSKRPGEHPSW